jgi:hypothetical protein
MSDVRTREQLLLDIQERPLITEILTVEPEIASIFHIAATFEDVQDRWHAYEALKQIIRLFVGHDAEQEQLRTTQHYDAMIDAVDALLPVESVEV